MNLLEATNSCLTALGEARVTSTEVRHPTVDLVLSTITLKKREFLERGWWFNTADVTMYPNTLNNMPYPDDAISIIGFNGETFIQRDGLLFNLDTNSNVFTSQKTMRITYDLDFDNLPESAAVVIWTRVAQEIYSGDYGVDSVVQRLALQEQSARANVDLLHMRNKRFSTRDRRGFRRIVRALSN